MGEVSCNTVFSFFVVRVQTHPLLSYTNEEVEELRAWKEKIDDVASPTQLKELVNEVDSLRTFKTKAVTAFVVVQFLMAAYAWALKAW